MNKSNRKITIPISIGYGLTDIMGGGAFTIIGALLLFYYTTIVGLTPSQAGSILLIARVVDAIVSLFMGGFSDHFYKTYLGKKFGRRRFFLLIGSPLMLVYVLMWVNGMNYWYYLASYLAFEIIAAVVLIPWETLPSEMTKDFNDRTKLSTCRMIMSALGTFLATAIPAFLTRDDVMGKENPEVYLINSIIFAIAFMICIFISWRVTWERELTPEMLKELEKEKSPVSFSSFFLSLGKQLKEILSTLQVRAFRKHLAIYLCSFTAKDVFNATLVFFCVYCLHVDSQYATTWLSMSIVGLPVTLLSGFLIIKFGPSRLYTFAYITMLLCLGGFFFVFLNPDIGHKIILLTTLAVIYQMGRCVLEFTPWNVFPFIPDIDEMITQQRREGLFAAMMTFSRKTTVGLASFIIGVVLEIGGFDKNLSTQPSSAIDSILILIFGFTSILLLIALWQALTFRLNKRTHQIFVNELERIKSDGAQPTSQPEVRYLVEDLTGYDYDQLWQKNRKA